MSKALPLLTLESRIKRELRKHLVTLGFSRDNNGFLKSQDSQKSTFRALHRLQRKEKLESHKGFVDSNWDDLQKYFANGTDVEPKLIMPKLERVYSNTWQSNLFRLASLTWSVPVSSGYGRRLRFLVWDESNGKLIGIFALGDPVFNLGARDQFIGWSATDRKEQLVNLLDAYVLGAVPPYNSLLCGKLVACLTNSFEVQEEFQRSYGDSAGVISSKQKNAKLLFITTTSSLGKSSIYNRLRLDGRTYFKSIGYTVGWGHFHVPAELFNLMRQYLEVHNHPYASNHAYGDGPNWKLRTVRAALKLAGINPDLLKHGIGREVFISVLARNASEVMCDKSLSLEGKFSLTTREIGILAVERWVIPKSNRDSSYSDWKSNQILSLINGEEVESKNTNDLVSNSM